MTTNKNFKETSNLGILTRAYLSGIGKTAIIYPAAFAASFALNAINLSIVYYVRETFNASNTEIGLTAGCWPFTYIIGCLLLRPRFKLVLPRFLMMSSMLLMAFFITAMLLSTSIEMLIIFYAAMGFILSLFWPPLMGWLSSDYEGSELSQIMSRFNTSWCSGAILGPLAGGWLVRINVALPLKVSLLIMFGTGLFIAGAAMALPRVKKDRRTGTPTDAEKSMIDKSTYLRFPAWIGQFSAFFCMGLLSVVFPLAGIERWALNETTVGFIFTLRGLANTIGFIILGRYIWWHFRSGPTLISQAMIVFIFLTMSFIENSLIIMFLQILFGFAVAMNYTSSVFHGVAGSLNRAKRMVINEAILSTGVVCGAIGGGWLYERLTIVSFFQTVSIIMACFWILQFVTGIFAKRFLNNPAADN